MGEEALGILAWQKISGMLVDARLVATASGELLSCSLERDPNLSILVSSSTGDVDEAVHHLQNGAIAYLRKPIRPHPTRSRISQLAPELAVERMRGLIGSVLAPEAHRALITVVESGVARAFVADERSKELTLEPCNLPGSLALFASSGPPYRLMPRSGNGGRC